MNRICLVCDVFHPSEESTSQLFSGLVAGLADDGLRFDVVTNRLPRSQIRAARSPNAMHGVRVHGVGISFQGRGSLFIRAVKNAAFVVCATIRMLWLNTDRFWASTNPPFTPVWVALVAWLRRKPFDIIVHDVYPDGLVAVGYVSQASLIAWGWTALNRWAYGRAAKVVVLGRDMADLLHRRYGIPHERLILFPNWSLFDHASPPSIAASSLAQKLNLTGKFVIQYSGNMGLWHDIDSIVHAAAMLHDVPDVHFLMVGGGRRRAGAMQLAASIGVRNMTWLDFQPQATLPDSLACASVALISQRDGLEGVAVPCKLYGILASGRAIIAAVPERSEAAQVVQETQCGVVLPPHDAAALATAIRKLSAARDDVAAMGQRAFTAYQQHYSLAAARRRYWTHWAAPSVGY
jgi:colanic acid biosynthesis glycosyl transferase WcaI